MEEELLMIVVESVIVLLKYVSVDVDVGLDRFLFDIDELQIDGFNMEKLGIFDSFYGKILLW